MFSMCGLLCRFIRGWRQTEAVGVMINAAIVKDASLLVVTKTTEIESQSSSGFCLQSPEKSEIKRKQLLWQDNDKQAKIIYPKEQIDLTRWTMFLDNEMNDNVLGHSSSGATSASRWSDRASSRKNSTCSECEGEITVLLEAMYRDKDDETVCGYNVTVEQLARPYAWKTRDLFGVIVHTTPTNLISMIHAFFNNALIIDDDLSISKILTVDVFGGASTLLVPSTIPEISTPEPHLSDAHSHTQFNPDEHDSPSSSALLATTPESETAAVTTVVEEDEDEKADRRNDNDDKRNNLLNVLIYTATNRQYFESVKGTLLSIFDKDRYVIYNLTEAMVVKSPWKSNTALLVVCGDVATHYSTEFIRFLLTGGKVLSICSDFLNVAVPLFGTVEVQAAGVVSMNYKKWKNVQLLHHKHCLHTSPKKFNTLMDEGRKTSDKGTAVSVEPTHVEITDEFGTHHRLDLEILAKDNTWKFPTIFIAAVTGGIGKAIFSQVHLEEEPSQSIAFKLTSEQLHKCNEWRLGILKDLLETQFEMKVEGNSKDCVVGAKDVVYTPAYVLGDHETKVNFFHEMQLDLRSPQSSTFKLSFLSEGNEDFTAPSQSHLPIMLKGCPNTFSTIKYFEALKTKKLGRILIYSEFMTSTMDVIKSTPPLGDGVVVLANQQTRGKGRSGNAWLSPIGTVLMSFQLHFPSYSNMGQSLPFLQHLVSLSLITGVKRIPGYERIPLTLKWPNDIYLRDEMKIGGVLVEVSTQRGMVVANVGCGINLWNSKPTTCINDAISDYNASNDTSLQCIQTETFCANTFNQTEQFLEELQRVGAENIIEEYYKHWLHGHSRVNVQNGLGEQEMVTIIGIDKYGFLLADSESGEKLVLHPDGNSFNMLEGLIYMKIPKN